MENNVIGAVNKKLAFKLIEQAANSKLQVYFKEID